MTMIHDDEAKVSTRWWVTTPVNRFVYEVFVARYYPTLGVEEYLTDGGWKSVAVGSMFEPALVLDARMIEVLKSEGVMDSGEIVDAIKALVDKCYEEATQVED